MKEQKLKKFYWNFNMFLAFINRILIKNPIKLKLRYKYFLFHQTECNFSQLPKPDSKFIAASEKEVIHQSKLKLILNSHLPGLSTVKALNN